jgi:hypothetical protein
MAPLTFNTVWYLPSENTWTDFNFLAFRDSGRLVVNPDSLEFTGGKTRLAIRDVHTVTQGKQGRDFVNTWVRVEYGEGQTAFFADGSLLGWGGVLGGTGAIYAAARGLVK